MMQSNFAHRALMSAFAFSVAWSPTAGKVGKPAGSRRKTTKNTILTETQGQCPDLRETYINALTMTFLTPAPLFSGDLIYIGRLHKSQFAHQWVLRF
jgi:hypothetical protein